MSLNQVSQSAIQREVTINANFKQTWPSALFAYNSVTSSGLTWGYQGGRLNGTSFADGTVALTASNTNYVVAHKTTLAVTASTAITNWNDTTTYGRCYLVVAGASTITGEPEDHRAGTNGILDSGGSSGTGYLEIPQNSKSADYTTVLGDSGKHIYHPSADTTPRTFTIDSNANVAYPLGTCITFVNDDSAGSLTIAITTDTMRLAGAGTTGSRTLAANGIATALKITTTSWIISGTGLT